MSKPILQLAALLVVGIVLFAVWLFKRNDRKGTSDSETGST